MKNSDAVKQKHTLSKQEIEARRNILEELFNDFSTSKTRVFWTNFVRGIFFGFGSVLGGTVVIAIVLTILSTLSDVPGGIGDTIDLFIESVRSRP